MKYLLFAFSLLAGASFGEFDHSRYEVLTIEEAVTRDLQPAPEAQFFYEMGTYKYAVIVRYTGNHRNTIYETKELLDRWVKSRGLPIEYLDLFPFEIEVSENENRYWLPIQRPLVQPFANEVPKDREVKLFIMAVGARSGRPIYIINEFIAQ